MVLSLRQYTSGITLTKLSFVKLAPVLTGNDESNQAKQAVAAPQHHTGQHYGRHQTDRLHILLVNHGGGHLAWLARRVSHHARWRLCGVLRPARIGLTLRWRVLTRWGWVLSCWSLVLACLLRWLLAILRGVVVHRARAWLGSDCGVVRRGTAHRPFTWWTRLFLHGRDYKRVRFLLVA